MSVRSYDPLLMEGSASHKHLTDIDQIYVSRDEFVCKVLELRDIVDNRKPQLLYSLEFVWTNKTSQKNTFCPWNVT